MSGRYFSRISKNLQFVYTHTSLDHFVISCYPMLPSQDYRHPAFTTRENGNTILINAHSNWKQFLRLVCAEKYLTILLRSAL